MSKFLEYKGYLGSLEIDLDEEFVYGRLMFIRDVVSYRANDVRGLKPAFEAAVDDYLATCAELGEVPDAPCKGTFNVRLGPHLHQRVAVNAAKEDISLNEWVKQACEMRLTTEASVGKDAPSGRLRTMIEASFEEEQVFGIGGSEDWQTQNNRHVH